MTRAVLSLGSNLGDRLGHLRAAVRDLGDVLLVASGVYETPPWGDDDQPPYLNAALLVHDAAATPRDWLDRARALEEKAGRVRDPDRRFGPRTLDVDVIAVWSEEGEPVVSDDPELTLPHPRAHMRAFVLRPWIDVEPYARLPGHGWLTDLLNAEPLASDALAISPRPDLRLESN
ncbi:2-amino-4-hydroxy-6-hydroxymethyldihydropteridine diphosphokinase [Phytohabitans sp. ZYX-F-186]|uniref:2-amino-4-hydroxy-6-hydroxymethyldihydropteridine diphosphokinase n=1 Tax=Phytohabitans maris TaxID=3071409 RepID=A0ABU0ZIR8_9ACTN|nr:2-amino-4-hydroxy-6-hydroxymethyldihydropteridine diphosphokinase [Phytohabitans sp. ZYX-F-186]MDQ7906945.1 2-amino-4-hydroxy-6-hydroxymethyldihydropteridine diphosphokinase [Phytohabitans sp. ZYX-F-186]